MKIDVKKLGSTIHLIAISGEMDMYNSQELKNAFLELVSSGIRGFILDMQDLQYIDSSGVSTLIFLHTTAKKKNLKLWFVNVKGSVLKVLELTKLTKILPLAGSLESLLAQFKKKPAAETAKENPGLCKSN
jgi:anti-sigma B factor antagonist